MLDKLEKIIKSEPEYRIKQAYGELFKGLISSWEEAQSLPKPLRDKLNQQIPIPKTNKILSSKDTKTHKAIIELSNGNNIETVLMRHTDNRNTACVSSQIGCRVGCQFCLTGQMNFKRSLTSFEIINQVLVWEKYLADSKEHVTNTVFMGMGEPFLNYANVIAAARTLNSPATLKIGARKISISTAGIPEKISKFATEDKQFNLAVSLHAPNNQLRSQLIPLNKKYPIESLIEAIDKYTKITNRKVMIEYLMLKGINDSVKHAHQLTDLLKDKLIIVNLISYNPTDAFTGSSKETITTFKRTLEKSGIKVTQRYKFGRDIKAACGQLSSFSSP